MSNISLLRNYHFVAEASDGVTITEAIVTHYDQTNARRIFWLSLTDAQRDAVADIELVDETAWIC